MTEIPEHLLERAKVARQKAAASNLAELARKEAALWARYVVVVERQTGDQDYKTAHHGNGHKAVEQLVKELVTAFDDGAADGFFRVTSRVVGTREELGDMDDLPFTYNNDPDYRPPSPNAGTWALVAGCRPDGKCPQCLTEMVFQLAAQNWRCPACTNVEPSLPVFQQVKP